jgi:hypothetical protein
MGRKATLKPQRATESATERQVGGKHYMRFKIQPIEFIVANKLNFIQGCIIKYICRFESKNGVEDLDKIIHYCELQKELLQNKK